MSDPTNEFDATRGNRDLQEWFNLSYACWLTIPRVFMEAMPDEWQRKMAMLLNEWDETWEWPDIKTQVSIKHHNKFVKVPEWLCNYRRPNTVMINSLRRSHMTTNRP